jgi:bifunctional non-homologous end joining protein LigD
MQLTHLDKLYWPKEGITKGDLLRYYSKVAPWILPHLKDRPVSLRRFPKGIEGESFFQKNLTNPPDWIETLSIEHKDKDVHYLLIQNEQSLLYAANLGCIEMHPFFSRALKLHNPDFLILDLDPKGSSFLNVIQVAQAIHEVLEEIKVPSFCKTSGATGLHIAIPLGAKYTYDQAETFAELIGQIVQKKLPKISTLERSLSKRGGKVYIDCRQNHFGQTLACPYSVRARPGATVSTPLQWKEVKPGLDPKKYTLKTIFARLKKWGDLYAPVLGKGINLKAALNHLHG